MVEPNLLACVLTAIDELKGQHVVHINVKPISSITDDMVFVSGSSNRHVKAIADKVVEDARMIGIKPIGVEGEETAEWILVDLGDVVVHIMLPKTREFYDLERLWSQSEAPSQSKQQ